MLKITQYKLIMIKRIHKN